MDIQNLENFIATQWDNRILPALEKFIAIPNQSPAFDAQWQSHGYMEQAVSLIVDWCQQQTINNAQIEVIRLSHRTPLIFIDIGADSDEHPVLLYGHLDKQPAMSGWRQGLEPWQAVRENEKLYGRGAADDGYAVFAAITAIKALQQQTIPHRRCIILIECCEESGSYDLPYYIDALQQRIGEPSLVIGLDSGCGNYDQLWNTTSLRGLVAGTLSIQLLTEGVHSGNASGIVASTFRILRQLLSRIENEHTGEILLPSVNCDIPKQRIEQAMLAADVLGDEVFSAFPFITGGQPVATQRVELILNRTWRAALAITGCDGIPSVSEAGNVLRPGTAVKLSLRIPPTADPETVVQEMKSTLENDPPYQAHVSFTPEPVGQGWHAPLIANWLQTAIDDASNQFFGAPTMHLGEGGTIPFMGMLGEKFPAAQFLITGVLGPHSNAHGPNEFLHIPYSKKLTACIAYIIAQHATKPA